VGKVEKGDMTVEWIESTGQFWLKGRGDDTVYVASTERENQEQARNIIDLMNAYLLTRPRID
jgi:N-dimethylarginine dimethylaminohydrolase